MTTPPPNPMTIAHYRLIEQLGEGGMAIVYRALDLHEEREVAVKLIRISGLTEAEREKILKRFEIEKKAAALRHPNITSVLDAGIHDGQPYLVMELVHGGSLKGCMGRPMDWREAARTLVPIAHALHYLHENDVVHRDVKPANILLRKDGQPLLADFGVAKILRDNTTTQLTATGASVGTPDYIAPEEALGRPAGRWADIYALGIVYYELITGRRPFQADTPMAVLLKHISEPLPSPRMYVPNLPARVEWVLLKALAKNPDHRYESAARFAEVLEKIADGERLKAHDAPRPRKHRHSRLVWAAVALLATIGIVAMAVGLGPLITGNPGTAQATPPAGNELSQQSARVLSVQGDVSSRIGDVYTNLASGQAVPVGAAIISANGQAELKLTEGVTILLGPDSEIELTSVAAPETGTTSTLVGLLYGKVLATIELQSGQYFAVQAPGGSRAEALSSMLGVAYDPGLSRLDMDCLDGHCRVVSSTAVMDLAGGQHTWLDGFGGPFAADGARWDEWVFANIDLPTPTAIITQPATPTLVSESPTAPFSQTAAPTLTHTATRTASPRPTTTRQPATATPSPMPLPTSTPQPTDVPPPPPPPAPTDPPPPSQTPEPTGYPVPVDPPTSTPVPVDPPTSTPVPPP